MVILDTNAILRVILKDNIEMESIVKSTLLEQSCLITVEVVAEIVYVLTKVYQINRNAVANMLQNFFRIKKYQNFKKRSCKFCIDFIW